jgi:hypothetical protein
MQAPLESSWNEQHGTSDQDTGEGILWFMLSRMETPNYCDLVQWSVWFNKPQEEEQASTRECTIAQDHKRDKTLLSHTSETMDAAICRSVIESWKISIAKPINKTVL